MKLTNRLDSIDLGSLPAKSKSYKLSDGHGLYLLVNSDGSKYWRKGYRFNHKQKTLAIGVYPSVTLAHARELSGDANLLLNLGYDPMEHKKIKVREGKKSPSEKSDYELMVAMADEYLSRGDYDSLEAFPVQVVVEASKQQMTRHVLQKAIDNIRAMM